jgi:hypothetical protein
MRDLVERRFSVERMVQSYLDAYESLLDPRAMRTGPTVLR